MFKTVFNLLFPLTDFLYILQLEEYNHRRYFKQVRRRFFSRGFQKRDQLKYTTRIKLIILGVLVLPPLLFLFTPGSLAIISTLVFWFFLPFYIGIVSIVIALPIWLVRKHKLATCKKWFSTNYPDTKIIGITGSYGKTTTKYALFELLKYNFATFIIPDNINTTLGIAEYLRKNPPAKNTQYLIVEMGAYEIGDIKEAATMLPPDIALLTCLGDQHIERFGSFENLVTGKNEIFTYAKPDAKKYTTTEAVSILSEQNKTTDTITTVEVAESPNLALAKKVAADLGVSQTVIAETLTSFQPPGRRNVTYVHDGITVIDNSYNISPQTAARTLKQAAEFAESQNKQVVVLTAGIGEQGIYEQEVNEELANLLNQYAGKTILLPSQYHDFIKPKLTTKIVEVEFALTVLESLSEYVDGETEVLLQLPEHTDLVYFT